MSSLHWKSGPCCFSSSRKSSSHVIEESIPSQQFSICRENTQILSHFGTQELSVMLMEIDSSEKTDHIIVHALPDWSKRFGAAEVQVSDHGSRFENKVVADLNMTLKTKYRCSFSHDSNRTIERVIREAMKVHRSLALCRVLSNNHPSASLARQDPITIFSGLPSCNPLAIVLQDFETVAFRKTVFNSWCSFHFCEKSPTKFWMKRSRDQHRSAREAS